jgi:hemerythrin-like domain-containing protein
MACVRRRLVGGVEMAAVEREDAVDAGRAQHVHEDLSAIQLRHAASITCAGSSLVAAASPRRVPFGPGCGSRLRREPIGSHRPHAGRLRWKRSDTGRPGMGIITQPLREEHKELIPHIERMRLVADAVGEVPPDQLRRMVDDAHDFLGGHLLPHAEAEERALYPVVARVIGGTEATGTMRRDHVEVSRLTEELRALRNAIAAEPPSAAQERELRRVLYGLYALVKVHFAKEEEVYLPLLDEHLSATDAQAMFAAMGHAAGEAKAHVQAH